RGGQQRGQHRRHRQVWLQAGTGMVAAAPPACRLLGRAHDRDRPRSPARPCKHLIHDGSGWWHAACTSLPARPERHARTTQGELHMNRKTLSALCAATALVLSPLALAGEEQVKVETETTETTVTTTEQVEFTQLDADGDGFVVQTEIPTELELAQVWVDFDA